MTNHIDTVMSMYAAFGRGDVAFILDQLADDIQWDQGVRDTGLSYLEPGVGKQHVVRFFTELSSQVEFTTFEPQTPCAAGDLVMIAVREQARNLETGAEIPDDLAVHIWRFGDDGRAVAFRHVADWATHEAAARSVPATASSQ